MSVWVSVCACLPAFFCFLRARFSINSAFYVLFSSLLSSFRCNIAVCWCCYFCLLLLLLPLLLSSSSLFTPAIVVRYFAHEFILSVLCAIPIQFCSWLICAWIRNFSSRTSHMSSIFTVEQTKVMYIFLYTLLLCAVSVLSLFVLFIFLLFRLLIRRLDRSLTRSLILNNNEN